MIKLIYYSIFFLFTIIYLIRGEKCSRALCFCVFLVLVLFATFRPEGMTDRQNYVDFFEYPWIAGLRFEPGFVLITKFIKSISDNIYVFFFCWATVAISLKLMVIRKITSFVLGSFLIYVSFFYILHDMIQMRCAVAAGLLLYAIYLKEGHKTLAFFIISTIAVFFHYSALVIYPIFFLSSQRIDKKLWISLIVMSYIIAGSINVMDIVRYIPISGIQELGNRYELDGGDVNIFSVIQLFRVFVCIFALARIQKLYNINKYSVILVKVYTIGVISLALFEQMPVIAFRVSQFFNVVEILLLPICIYSLRLSQSAKKIMICFIALAFSIMSVFLLHYLDTFRPI